MKQATTYDLAQIELMAALGRINVRFTRALEKRPSTRISRKNKKATPPDPAMDHRVIGRMLAPVERRATDIVCAATFAEFAGTVDRYIALMDELRETFVRHERDFVGNLLVEIGHELYPRVAQLKSLIHIVRAHPVDAIKRARKIA
jgi:hypothetical protein